MKDWLLEQARLTVFPTLPVNPDGIHWWEECVGAPPDQRTSKAKLFELHEEGLFGQDRLLLNVAPVRIDWNLLPSTEDPVTAVGPPMPLFGVAAERFPAFLALAQKWAKSSMPTANRIALGIVLLRPTKDRPTGYSELSKLLPNVNLNPTDGMSDFFYQINRPRKSVSLPNAVLNRLTKWSVSSIQKVFFVAGSGGPPVSSPETFFVRAELDINVLPVPEITGELAHRLLKEFAENALELVAKGDVP